MGVDVVRRLGVKQLALAALCTVLPAIAAGVTADAQEQFPARPIQVIVPATAGGPVDTAVRMIAPATGDRP